MAILQDVEIDISPDRFIFSSPGKQVSLATVVYLQPNGKNQMKVAGIGEPPPGGSSQMTVVRLFENDPGSTLASKYECLETFLKYGLQLTCKSFIRPKVTLKNADSISKILAGYHKTLLARTTAIAGARKVLFATEGSSPESISNRFTQW